MEHDGTTPHTVNRYWALMLHDGMYCAPRQRGNEIQMEKDEALAEGRRAGAILFARNIEDADQVVALNAQIIEEFRANQGKVAMFADYPMVILHTIGAKSGNLLLAPLVLTINKSEEWLLFGSYAGAKQNPSWVYNLRANPEIDIEFGVETFRARIEELSGDEAKRKVDTQAELSEQFAGYVTSAAPRHIPVFRITRI